MRFNLEFIITLLAALFAAYLVNRGSPNVSPYITFLILPLLVAYLIVVIINNIWPGINLWGRNVANYVEDNTLGTINETNYLQIFPPLFIVLVIFVILLYNGILN